MKQALVASALAAVGLSLGAGYWLGSRTPAHAPASVAAGSTATADKPGQRKILYYRNPMGLPDTSPVPKKDPMGMDYIAVYEGEEPAGAASDIRINADKVQKMGVRTEPVALRNLDRSVRAVGRVEPDERRTYMVAPRFEGYVERLHVNVTGQPVAKGQPLFEVYSPELVSAQREYAIAMEGLQSLKDGSEEVKQGMRRLAEASLARLKNWDISEEQVKALARSGQSRRTLTVRAPVSGVISEKKAVQGMRFEAGEALYQISDLSSVWVVAEVFEQDIGMIRPGARADVRLAAYPGERFTGRIAYVYPTLNAETRTVPVRIELANRGGRLKPAMFAQVELAAGGGQNVLTVPDSAVIDSGTRTVALVQTGEGRFAAREVKLGMRGGNYVEVLSGLKEGEPVVVAANFLIDAESNLKAALGGLGQGAASAPVAPAQGASVAHQADGQIDSVDAKGGTLTLRHGPVPSLKWPGMTMEFKLANGGLAAGLKPGQAVRFEFVERAQGEYVITKIASAPPAAAAPAAARDAHAGH